MGIVLRVTKWLSAVSTTVVLVAPPSRLMSCAPLLLKEGFWRRGEMYFGVGGEVVELEGSTINTTFRTQTLR